MLPLKLPYRIRPALDSYNPHLQLINSPPRSWAPIFNNRGGAPWLHAFQYIMVAINAFQYMMVAIHAFQYIMVATSASAALKFINGG